MCVGVKKLQKAAVMLLELTLLLGAAILLVRWLERLFLLSLRGKRLIPQSLGPSPSTRTSGGLQGQDLFSGDLFR